MDSHEMFRQTLKLGLEREGGFEVIGEADCGEDAVAEALRLEPDVIVAEILLLGLSGVEATRRITAENPGAQVLMLSSQESGPLVRDALRAGALGYVVKASPLRELFEAIRAVGRATSFLSPSVTRHVIANLSESAGAPDSMATLTVREREVLLRIAEGLSSKEIAEDLHVATRTIETHRNKLMRKVGAHKVSELVRLAIREGLLKA